MRNLLLLLTILFVLSCKQTTSKTTKQPESTKVTSNDENVSGPNWFMDRGSLAGLGSRRFQIITPVSVIREIDLGGEIIAPLVGDSEKVYVIVGTELKCLRVSSSEEIWNFELSNRVFKSPHIIQENKGEVTYILVTDSQGTVYSINGNNGEEYWRNEIEDGSIYASAPIIVDGNVYVVRSSGIVESSNLDAIDFSSGQTMWSRSAGVRNSSTPINLGSSVLIGSNNNESVKPYIRYDRNGNIKWFIRSLIDDERNHTMTRFTNGIIDTDVESGEQVKVYCATKGQNSQSIPSTIKCLNYSDGGVKWQVNVPLREEVTSLSMLNEEEEKIFVYTTLERITRFSPENGETIWSTALNRPSEYLANTVPQPILLKNKIIHVNGSSVVTIFNPETGSIEQELELEGLIHSSPIAGHEYIMVGTNLGKVYIIG